MKNPMYDWGDAKHRFPYYKLRGIDTPHNLDFRGATVYDPSGIFVSQTITEYSVDVTIAPGVTNTLATMLRYEIPAYTAQGTAWAAKSTFGCTGYGRILAFTALSDIYCVFGLRSDDLNRAMSGGLVFGNTVKARAMISGTTTDSAGVATSIPNFLVSLYKDVCGLAAISHLTAPWAEQQAAGASSADINHTSSFKWFLGFGRKLATAGNARVHIQPFVQHTFTQPGEGAPGVSPPEELPQPHVEP